MSNARNLANFKPSASGQVETADIADAAVTAGKLDTGAAASNLGNYVSTVNGSTGAVTVQPTLVSGTNIKTINSTSLLGSGDIAITSSPAGSNTYVQYNNSGSFGGSANFVFDGTNVGIGTSSPADKLDVNGKSTFRDNIRLPNTNYIYSYAGGTATTVRSGMYLDGTNNLLALITNDTERLRIGSSGQLGIGGANYGTSGQVLTSAGSGAAPSWQTPGGAWALVGSGSFSNSSSVGISNFSSTYDNYCIVLENVMSSSAGHSLYMGINISGYGYLSDFKASSYAWSGTSTTWSNSGNYGYDGLIAQYLRRYSDETNSFGYRVIVWLLDTNNTTNKKGAIGTFGGVNNGLETQSGHFACWGNDTTGTVAAVRFTSNQGASNLYGKYQIYGIKTS